MAQLRIDKILDGNVYKVTFEMINLTANDKILVEEFGEPNYTFGGSYTPTAASFLTKYFPDSSALIPSWVQFKEYSTGDEVKFNNNFFRALQTVNFLYPDWVMFKNEAFLWNNSDSFTAGDIVFYAPDGKFYEAQINTTPGSTPLSSPSEYDLSTAPIVKFTDGKYYKAKREIDFSQFATWSAGVQYTEDTVVNVAGNYYKAIQDSPSSWLNTKSDYSVGDLVHYSGTFYEATANNPTVGTRLEFTLTGVTGSFVAGQTVNSTSSPSATATVVSYNSISKVLAVTPVSGNFSVSDVVEVNSSPPTGSGTISTIKTFDPASNAAQWTTTLKADPVSDGGVFWTVFADFNPIAGPLFWEVFTDKDPSVSGSTFWQSFDPTLEGREEPFTTTSWTVNQIIVALPSGTPITFSFDGAAITDAEARADDFAVIVKTDVKGIWDAFETNMNQFDETEIFPL